jgi:hypothetical protein
LLHDRSLFENVCVGLLHTSHSRASKLFTIHLLPKMKTTLLSLALVTILAAPLPALAAGKGQPMTIPDFTEGGTIPAGAKHDWNLGPTGLRGWMFCDKLVTADARQISITKVEKGSPADGVFLVGDVILGLKQASRNSFSWTRGLSGWVGSYRIGRSTGCGVFGTK